MVCEIVYFNLQKLHRKMDKVADSIKRVARQRLSPPLYLDD